MAAVVGLNACAQLQPEHCAQVVFGHAKRVLHALSKAGEDKVETLSDGDDTDDNGGGGASEQRDDEELDEEGRDAEATNPYMLRHTLLALHAVLHGCEAQGVDVQKTERR